MPDFILSILNIDIDLSAGRPGEQSIHKVFVDPGGSHCIATIVGSGGAETFYTHAKWSKPRVLSKLKGIVVNAVAWNRQQITEGNLLIAVEIAFVLYRSKVGTYLLISAAVFGLIQLPQRKSFSVQIPANFMRWLWMRRTRGRNI